MIPKRLPAGLRLPALQPRPVGSRAFHSTHIFPRASSPRSSRGPSWTSHRSYATRRQAPKPAIETNSSLASVFAATAVVVTVGTIIASRRGGKIAEMTAQRAKERDNRASVAGGDKAGEAQGATGDEEGKGRLGAPVYTRDDVKPVSSAASTSSAAADAVPEIVQRKEHEAQESTQQAAGAGSSSPASEGAFNEETGEINWDCPCLGGMAHGPCGEEFKAAFSCFVFSEAEPKGVDCVEKFKGMQDCFRQHPDVYGEEIDDDEDPQGQDGQGAAESSETRAAEPVSASVAGAGADAAAPDESAAGKEDVGAVDAPPVKAAAAQPDAKA